MESLCSQPLWVAHFRPQLGPSEGQPFTLQWVQARMERCEMVRASHGGQRDGTMPGKVLHWVCRRVECVHLWRFNLKSRFHPFPQFPLANFPLTHLPLSQLALPHGWVSVIQAGHVIGQQRVRRVEGHKERVVSIGGGHDVGASVLAEGAQGRGIRANVGRHSCNRSGGAVKGRTHVGRAGHLRFTHSAFMRGTRGFRSSLCFLFSFPLPFSLFFPLPLSLLLFSCFLFCFPLGFLQSFLSLLGQFR